MGLASQSCLVLTSLGDLFQLPVFPYDMTAVCEVMLASSANRRGSYQVRGRSSFSSVEPWVRGLLQVLSRVAAESLMLDGQLLVQLSTSLYYCGWYLSPRSLSRTFHFFLGWVRLLNTLIVIPQHGLYFGGICGEKPVDGTSFILTIIPLQSSSKSD